MGKIFLRDLSSTFLSFFLTLAVLITNCKDTFFFLGIMNERHTKERTLSYSFRVHNLPGEVRTCTSRSFHTLTDKVILVYNAQIVMAVSFVLFTAIS
jgi:hypothetical protein